MSVQNEQLLRKNEEIKSLSTELEKARASTSQITILTQKLSQCEIKIQVYEQHQCDSSESLQNEFIDLSQKLIDQETKQITRVS